MKRSRAIRVLGGAALAPALVTGFPAIVRSQTLTPLKIGIIPVDVAANAYYAQDLGLFTKAGFAVEFQVMASGPVLAQAVAGGAIDIGISNIATLANARLRGLPFRVLAPAAVVNPGQKPTDVVMVLQDSAITPGAGMNGKLIAINGLKDLQEIEARGYVDRFGGDSSTIKFVEVPFPAMGGALSEKRVDIIFPTEPFSTANLNVGKIIGDAFDGVGPKFLLLGWFATETWLASNAATAKKFVDAMRQASVWANSHQTESAVMLSNHTKMPPEIASKIVRAVYGTTLDPTMLAPVLNLGSKYALISKPVPPTDLIWKG